MAREFASLKKSFELFQQSGLGNSWYFVKAEMTLIEYYRLFSMSDSRTSEDFLEHDRPEPGKSLKNTP